MSKISKHDVKPSLHVNETENNIERELQFNSDERFRSLFDNMLEGCQVIGFDWTYLYLNNAADVHNRRPKEELLGKKYTIMWPGIENTEVFRLIKQCMEKRIPCQVENEFIFPDGEAGWFKLSIQPIPEGVFILSIDITDLKKTEEALRKNEEFTRAIMDNLPIGIAVNSVDPSVTFEYMNDHFPEFYHTTREELTRPDNFWNAVYEDSEFRKEIMNRVLADCNDGNPERMYWEDVPVTRNGEGIYYITARNIPILEKKLMISTVWNVTERKQVEDALRESERRMREIQKMAHLGSWYWDVKTGNVEWSDEVYKIFRLDPKEFTPTIGSILELSPWPEDHERDKELIKRAIETRKQGFYEQKFLRPDKSIGFYSSTFQGFFDESGDLISISGTILDITEQKRAEETLKESEEKYRLISDHADDWVYWISPEGKYRYTSPSCERLTGYSPKEFSEHVNLLLEITFAEDRTIIESHYLEINEKSKTDNLEFRIVKKSGEVIWISHSCSPIFTNEGEFAGRRGTNRNITDRKHIQEELRRNEERLRLSLNAANQGLYDLNVQTGETIVNDEYAIMLGYDPKTFKESNAQWIERLHPDDRELSAKAYTDYIEGKTSEYKVEFRQKTKDNNWKWILSLGKIVKYDLKGKPLRMLGTHTDITERKKAEEKILEKDIQFRKLSSNVPDLFFQFTRRPDGSYCVPLASEGIRNIFGCSPEDVIEDFTPIAKVIFPEDTARVISEIEYSAKNLTYFTCEFRVQIPGRKIQWIYSRSAPEKLADGSITWYGFNADITERKLAEELLIKAKEKAEESDRLKSAFLHNISHEIRTPMNAIVGFSGLLSEKELPFEKQKQFTDLICQSSNQLLSIITDIINISTIEAGQMKITEKEVNLNILLFTLYQQFETNAKKKEIELQVKTGLSDNESDIIIDETKLMEILSNLINNALKFTKKGYVRFGYLQKKDKIEFFVEDSGIGIPADMHEKIFERFRQADSSISREYGGTGLGLSISLAYVKLMAGEIWIESEPAKGSVFFFNIPYKKVVKNKFEGEKITKDTVLKFNQLKTVLVAEDEENNYLLIEEYLNESNISLLWAKNGVEAVDICNINKTIDLIFMDIKMPRMNGYDATRKIKALNPLLPVIAVTAYTQSEDTGKAIESGCSDYLSKPVRKDELVSVILKYLK